MSLRVKTAALQLFLRTLKDVPQTAAAGAVLFFAADAVDAPVAGRPHPVAEARAPLHAPGQSPGSVHNRVPVPAAAPVLFGVGAAPLFQ